MNSIIYAVDGPIASIILNRPEKLNALNAELMTEMGQALDMAESDPAVRVVIVKGAGRAFSAGHDISPHKGTSHYDNITDDRERLQGTLTKLMRFWDFPKPVIAQVHGYCIGVGSMLPIFCDLTIVSEECKIRWPALPLGGGLISTLWTWLVGPKKAKEMSFIAGSEMTGEEALFWGWANRAVPEARLEETTRRLAMQISKTPPDLLRLKKLAINRVMEIQGFRTAAMAGAEWDAITHFSEGVQSVRGTIRELGLKGAIAQFKAD